MKQVEAPISIREETYQPLKVFDTSRILKDLCAGSIAGIASTISGHPLDTIRVRVQVLNEKAIACAKGIIKTEGAVSLYKGVGSPLATVPIMQAIYFGSYELAKRVQGFASSDDMTLSQIVLAGVMTGLPYALGTTPIDLVKCRLQMEGTGQKGKGTGTLQMAKRIVHKEGSRGLFRGFGICLLRDLPGNATQLGAYEFFKRRFRSWGVDPSLGCFLAGGAGNVVCWLVSYPMDIIKTQLQVKQGEPGKIRDYAKKIWKSKGPLGFYRGITPTLARAILSGSFSFSMYEAVKTWTK